MLSASPHSTVLLEWKSTVPQNSTPSSNLRASGWLTSKLPTKNLVTYPKTPANYKWALIGSETIGLSCFYGNKLLKKHNLKVKLKQMIFRNRNKYIAQKTAEHLKALLSGCLFRKSSVSRRELSTKTKRAWFRVRKFDRMYSAGNLIGQSISKKISITLHARLPRLVNNNKHAKIFISAH